MAPVLENLTRRTSFKLLLGSAAASLMLAFTACGTGPTAYRFSADFTSPIGVPAGSDVRIGKETVGEVVESSTKGGGEHVVMEIDPDYAPIDSDAKAIVRRKTPFGEVYVELAAADWQRNPEFAGVVRSTTDSRFMHCSVITVSPT